MYGLDTSFSMTPVNYDRLLEESSISLELRQSVCEACGTLNDVAGLILAKVFDDVCELVVCWLSLLDVCRQ